MSDLVLGKYRVLRPLASGGMADVLLAEMKGLAGFHKLVVLKRMRPALAKDASFRAMFVREVTLASRLAHPNVVQTYEVCEDKGEYLLAMEHIDGQPLSRIAHVVRRSGESIDPHIYVRVIADALAGLAYAHRLNDFDGTPLMIVHRDISPQNIMVTYDGDTKLLDFGIAKAANSVLLTQQGVLKGKLAYMAPEQARGEKLDRRADLFAMGVLLWELLAGKRLFFAGNNAETFHRLLVQPVPNLPHVDPELDAIVMKALERDKKRRWRDAEEMKEALDDYLARKAPHATRQLVSRVVSNLFAAERAEDRLQVRKALSPMAVTMPPPEPSPVCFTPPPAPPPKIRTWPLGMMGVMGGLAFCALSFLVAKDNLPQRPAHTLARAVPQVVAKYKISIAENDVGEAVPR